VWTIKIYTDSGRPWVRGDFWSKDVKGTKTPLPISSFDGQTVYLFGDVMLLPVGEHYYPRPGQDTKVIVYPLPSAAYTSPKSLSEKSVNAETW
jgi:hypothetical protein